MRFSLPILGGSSRTALFLALLILVSIAAVVGTVLWRSHEESLNHARTQSENIARLLEEQTLRTFQAADLLLQGMSEELSYHVTHEHDAAFEAGLRRRLQSLPNVRALFVIGADGFITQDTDYPHTPRVSLADRDYFTVHQQNPRLGLYVGPPLQSRSVGKWFVSMSRRMQQPDGSFGGVVVAAVEPGYYESIYAGIQLAAGSAISLFHKSGALVAREPESFGLVGKSLPHLRLFQTELPRTPHGTFALDDAAALGGGGARLISYRALADLPFVVSVSVSRDAILAGWWRTARTLIGLTAIIAAVSMAGTLLLLRRHNERRKAAVRARAAENLRTIGQMTGGIAHDFNNVLAALAASLSLVESNAHDPRKMHKFLAAAQDAIRQGSGLTSRLLAFAKHKEEAVEVVDANDLLKSLQPILRQVVGPNIRVAFDLVAGLEPCRVDRARFDSAIMNLAINARDAMPDGGRLSLATSSWVQAKTRRNKLKAGRYVRVSMRDIGAGMAAHTLERAFDPFFTTKGDKGTGLGLTQVLTLMHDFGGEITIESKLGAGTTVDLFFPCVHKTDAQGSDLDRDQAGTPPAGSRPQATKPLTMRKPARALP